MANLKKTTIKIYKNQLLERLISYKKFLSLFHKLFTLITIDFNYVNVFFEKIIDSFALKNFVNLFVIEFDSDLNNSNNKILFDVNNH